MIRFFKNLRFHKMDEMQQNILFKAQRNAYVFLVVSLLIWTFYESYKVYAYHTRLNLFPCALLVTAVIIQSFSQLIMTRNAVKDDVDSCETTPLFEIIILICVVASVIIAIVTSMLFMSVRI